LQLPELQWLVLAPQDVWGTTVQLTGGPFVHSQRPEYRADCRMNVRMLRTAGRLPWHINTASDSTHVTHNDLAATVSASSLGNGAAILGLQATFVPPAGPRLPAGVYVTQVVGLVTGI
jgi:hypothetical protein